jgi:hypothetical protein
VKCDEEDKGKIRTLSDEIESCSLVPERFIDAGEFHLDGERGRIVYVVRGVDCQT